MTKQGVDKRDRPTTDLDFALRGCHNAPQPDPGGKLGVGGVTNVVLDQIPSQPVGEVQPVIVKGDKDVGDEGGNLRQDPVVNLGPRLLDDDRRLPLVIA